MSFEQASAALKNFTELQETYKNACDTEAARLAEKLAADAELGLATSYKDTSDAAAEEALRVLLVALEEVGIKP